MDYFTTMHLMDLYGLNPNIQPYAFQFPRVPPSLSHPMQNTNKISKKNSHTNESLIPKLEDFQQMYRKYASGILDMIFPGIIPPGHPLYSRHFSVEILQSERDTLLKENLELRKKLEKLSKEKQS
jgi:hypothetical protein